MLKNYSVLLFVLLLSSCSKLNKKQNRLSTINEIVKFHELTRDSSRDSAVIYLQKADQLMTGLKPIPDSLKIQNSYRKGRYFLESRKLDSASYFFQKSVDLITIENNKESYEKIFRDCFDTYLLNENYANGIEVATNYQGLLDEQTDYVGMVYVYNFFCRVYRLMGDYDKALFYDDKTIKMARLAKNEDMLVITYSGRTDLLFNHLNQKEEAFRVMDSLLEFEQNNSDFANWQLYNKLGMLHYFDSNFNEAIKNYKKALLAFQKERTKPIWKDEIQADGYEMDVYLNISEAYIELKEFEKANKYLDSAATFSDRVMDTGTIDFFGELRLRYNYFNDSDISEVIQDYYALKKNQDKLHQKRIDEELLALTNAISKEKSLTKEKQEAELANMKLRTRNWILLSAVVLVLILGYLLYSRRKLKFEKKSIEMQQRLLRAQMNPHFTFNILSAIQNLMESGSNKSVLYLVKFSRHLRLVLENSTSNFVLLSKELEALEKYIELQQLRFSSKFQYKITLTHMQQEHAVLIPPMLLQPLVENSIEHGFSNIEYQGDLQIRLSGRGKFLACEIEDNGSGFLKSNPSNKKSLSTKLISEYLQKTTNSQLELINKNDQVNGGSGVLIRLLIPYKLDDK